jgi:hypothetical protein
MSDWDDFGTLWRSNEPPELGDLRRRLKRQSFYIKAWFAQEIVLALAASGLGIWLMLSARTASVGAGAVAFAAFALFMSWRAWRGSFTVETGTPNDVIASAIARNDTLSRYIRANYIISVVAVIFLIVIMLSDPFGDAMNAARLQKNLIVTIVVIIAIAVWVAGCWIYARRLQRERERLIALGRALGFGST